MNLVLRMALSVLVAMIAMFISFSANAQTGNRLHGPGDHGYDTLVTWLASMRHDPAAVRCVFFRCQSLRSHPRGAWRHSHFYRSCYNDHLKRKETDDYKPFKNPPGVHALLCSNELETNLPRHNKEVGERVFSRYDRAEPIASPKPAMTNAEANELLAELKSGADAEVDALRETPPAAYTPGTPEYAQQKYRAWAAKNPEAARTYNAPAQQAVTPPGYAKLKINCIPKNVSLVKLEDNGDSEWFIHEGADIAEMKRCMPNVDWDAEALAAINIAAAFNLYYKENPGALHGNTLVFHQGRWWIKRDQWKIPAKDFFAEFFKEHKGKEFGIALQPLQKLKLAVKKEVPPTKESVSPTPTAPAKHGKSGEFSRGETQNAYASLNTALPATRVDASMSASASVYEPCRHSGQVELGLAEIDRSQSGSTLVNEIQSADRAYIRVGSRVARVKYKLQERYRWKSGADLNTLKHIASRDAHDNMSLRRQYGPYAFG